MRDNHTSFIMVSNKPLHLGLELGHIFELWHPGDLDDQGEPKNGEHPLCILRPGSYSLRSKPVRFLEAKTTDNSGGTETFCEFVPMHGAMTTDNSGGTEIFSPRYKGYSTQNPVSGAALAIIDPDSAPPRKFP